MGLTIHYTIRFDGSKQELVSKLQAVRQKCLDLPFENVSTVDQKEITPQAIKTWDTYQFNRDFTTEQRDAAIAEHGLDAWDIISASDYNAKPHLQPCSLVSLGLWPGKGCESSDLGFNKRPRQKYWRCSSFCKTQYADHFVRCHLLVVQLMDIIKGIDGFTVEVTDEGEYWETRSIETLAKNINESTAMIKGVLGALQANMGNGMTIEANIDKSENYINIK